MNDTYGRSSAFPEELARTTHGAADPAGFEAIDRATEWADRFTLGRELGRGGMGAVYAAYDHRLCRTVAIKVLNAEQPTAADLARFLREVRVTGRLSHPGIPPVYEVGRATSGHPYMAMKLVSGASLRSHLDLARKAPRARGAFGMARRLEILARVAEALAYAHEQRVLHRDLKPDNVMVGEFGEVQVMDWGLAKLLDAPDSSGGPADAGPLADSDFVTVAGSVAGTPAYMAPEQANGDATRHDVRTDVYALGGLLYELLTLTPPHRGGTVLAVLARAGVGHVTNAIRRVSAAQRPRPPAPPRELAAIAERAMAPDPEGRYPDVESFLRDLRAFHAHEPVSAHVDGLVARAAKWSQRHPRATLGLAAALVIGVLSGLLAAAVARAELRDVQATAERHRADAAQARAAALGRHVSDKLDAASAAAIEELQTQWARATTTGVSDQEFFGSLSASDLARFRKALEDALEVKAVTGARATADDHVCRGMIRAAQGATPDALADYDRALELEPGHLVARTARGILRGASGDPSGALADFEQVIASDPDEAGAYANRAAIRLQLGARDLALADYDRAVELAPNTVSLRVYRGIARAMTGDSDGALADLDRAIELQPTHADARVRRATLRRERGDEAGALADLDAVLAFAPRSSASLMERGAAHLRLGNADAARRDFDLALAIDGDNVRVLTNRGLARFRQGDAAGALADLARALELEPRCVDALVNRAFVALGQRDYPLAIADCTRALEIQPRADAYMNLGAARRALGELEAAEAAFTAAIALEPTRAEAYAQRGLVQSERGDLIRAMADYERALALRRDDVATLNNRANLLKQNGDLAGALRDYDRGIAIAPRAVQLRLNRGLARQMVGDAGGAAADFEVALELDGTAWVAAANLAVMREASGRRPEAIELARRAITHCKDAQSKARLVELVRAWGGEPR